MESKSGVERRGSFSTPRRRADAILCIPTGGAVERGTAAKKHLRVGEFTGLVFSLEENKQVKGHHSLTVLVSEQLEAFIVL